MSTTVRSAIRAIPQTTDSSSPLPGQSNGPSSRPVAVPIRGKGSNPVASIAIAPAAPSARTAALSTAHLVARLGCDQRPLHHLAHVVARQPVDEVELAGALLRRQLR